MLFRSLAWLTGWIPFSLAEFLLILLPVILVCLILYGVRKNSESWRDVFIFCGSILSVLAAVSSVFLVGFAPAYRGTTLDRKLKIAVSQAASVAQTYNCLLTRLDFQQEDGLMSSLPLGLNCIKIERSLTDRKSTRLNSSHDRQSRMPSSA